MSQRVLLLLIGQTLSASALSQSSASVNIDRAELNAGDRVTAVLTFDEAFSCPNMVYLYFRRSPEGNAIVLSGTSINGSNAVSVSNDVPKDYKGTYESSQILIQPCPGYSEQRTIAAPKATLNVAGIPNTQKLPSKASVDLLLTQKQFLDTRTVELRDLSGQVDSRVEENAADTPDLRLFLLHIVEMGQIDLKATAEQYRKQMLKAEERLPVFFADFERQYSHLHDELKAPIPGTKNTLRTAYKPQLTARDAPRALKSGNISGTSPAIARAVKQTVDDNAAAYDVVSTTGRATFHAQFSSHPTGAALYYRQAIIPDFQLWPTSTDISGVDLELATFVFKFHKDECADEPVRTVDPYSDTHPVISVEFKRCKKR